MEYGVHPQPYSSSEVQTDLRLALRGVPHKPLREFESNIRSLLRYQAHSKGLEQEKQMFSTE